MSFFLFTSGSNNDHTTECTLEDNYQSQNSQEFCHMKDEKILINLITLHCVQIPTLIGIHTRKFNVT